MKDVLMLMDQANTRAEELSTLARGVELLHLISIHAEERPKGVPEKVWYEIKDFFRYDDSE